MAGDSQRDPRLEPLAAAARTRRRALKLRQREVADLAGCSERFVYTLEQAKGSVRFDKVLDVLDVLGLGLEVGVGAAGISARAVAPDRRGGHPVQPDGSR